MIEFLFKHPSGEMRTWTPSKADINEWRSEFPGINVIEQLNALADWTVKNQHIKSKQRNIKTAPRWIKSMLKREWQKSESASRVTQARVALSRTEWERRGMTEDQWRKEQSDIFYAKKQESIVLDGRGPDPEVTAMLKRLSADLRALCAEAAPTPRVGKKTHWTACNHVWKRHHYLPTLWCPGCGMTQDRLTA